MKTTYKLSAFWPRVTIWLAIAAAIFFNQEHIPSSLFYNYRSGSLYLFIALLSVLCLSLCAHEVHVYTNRTILLKDPNFKVADLEYKSKHELKRLEQHARMIGDKEKELLIAEYVSQRESAKVEQ